MDVKAVASRAGQTVPGKVGRKFLEDQAPNWAVLIAWNALFAFFPILLLFLSLLGLIFGGRSTASFLITVVNTIQDPDAQVQFKQLLTTAHRASGIFFVVGVIGLVWSGSALFGVMDQVFAYLYHTKQRPFIPQKLMAVGMVLLFTALAGIAVLSSSVLPALHNIPFLPRFMQNAFSLVIQVVVGVVAGTILYLAIYYVVPNRRQQLSRVWPGALAAGVLFEIVTLIFPLYLSLTHTGSQYGKTFGLFFIILTFFFFFGLITMVGAEVNSVIYPVPVEQPFSASKPGETAGIAPPGSGPEAERPTPLRRRPAPDGRRAREPELGAMHQPNGSPPKTKVGPVSLLLSAALGFIVGRSSRGAR
jgi:membrane protein